MGGWDTEAGIRIAGLTKIETKKKELSDKSLDFGIKSDRDKSLIIEPGTPYYKEYSLVVDDKLDFDEFIIEMIEKYFNGKEGKYWIGGRDTDQPGRERWLWNQRVLMFYYDGEQIEPIQNGKKYFYFEEYKAQISELEGFEF